MSNPPLNAEQQQIVMNKQVRLQKPIGELIDVLKPIAEFDVVGGRMRTRYGCSAAFLFVAGCVLLIVNMVTVTVVLALVMFAGGAALTVLATRAIRDDVSDNLSKCAVPLLVALREDFGPEPVQLTLDLRLPMSQQKRTGSAKVDNVTTTTYTDAWMSGEGILADGSRLRWSVVDAITERAYWKRGSSGKQKMKRKYKKRVAIDVDLTLRAKTYAVEGEEKKQTLHADAKVKHDSADPIPPDDIINVIAGLYAQVRPAS